MWYMLESKMVRNGAVNTVNFIIYILLLALIFMEYDMTEKVETHQRSYSCVS